MPATAVLKGGKVKGEGRVISINAKYGFLAAQGINSKVFIIPSSLRVDAPFPALTDELHIDDLVTFEASEQVERNGAKYLAVDGSVKLKQRGRDVMVEGEGKIVRLDAVRGCFGFVDSAKVGSVFFNISAVRPATTDVTKVLKLGQKVKFRALPNSEQPNCKWRASIVCAFNKAHEYLIPTTNNVITTTNNNSTTVTISNGVAACSAHTNGITSSNNNHIQDNKILDAQGASTTNNCSSFSQVTKVKKACTDNTKVNQRTRKLNNNHTAPTNNCTHPSVVGKKGGTAENGATRSGSVGGIVRPQPTTRPSTNGAVSTSAENLHQNFTNNDSSSCSAVFKALDNNGFSESSNQCSNLNVDSRPMNGTCSSPPSANGISNNVNNNNNSTSNNCASASKHGWGWPSVDQSFNPAAMWDLYLEQQQKALNQTYNPFSVYVGGKDCCCCCLGHVSCSNSAYNASVSDVCDRPVANLYREDGACTNGGPVLLDQFTSSYGYGTRGGACDSPLDDVVCRGGGASDDDRHVNRLARQINGWAVLNHHHDSAERDAGFIDGHK